jgi:hypothetical protein
MAEGPLQRLHLAVIEAHAVAELGHCSSSIDVQVLQATVAKPISVYRTWAEKINQHRIASVRRIINLAVAMVPPYSTHPTLSPAE